MRHYIGGALVATLGVIVLAGALLTGRTSPRGWIGSHYPKISNGVYRASGVPTAVAGRIARKFKPSDRVYDPAGVFLRYPSVVVAVLPDGRGSRILVDSASTGYRRHYSYVGGRWGGPGGRASMFRGGGPGSGK